MARSEFQKRMSLIIELWHTFAAPYLYHIIATFNYPLLFVGLDNPPIAGIMSKRELFIITERIYFEYDPDLPYPKNVTFEELEQYMLDRWDNKLEWDDLDYLKKKMSREKEMKDILESWKLLPVNQDATPDPYHSDQVQFETIFTNVSSVAVDTLLEQSEDRWYSAEEMEDYHNMYWHHADSFSSFLNAHQSIASVCQTGDGPISFSHCNVQNRTAPTLLNHHSTRGYCKISWMDGLASGISTRWYLHLWPAPYLAEYDLLTSIHWSFAYLKTDEYEDGKVPDVAPELDWGVYYGPRNYVSESEKDEVATEIKVQRAKFLRAGSQSEADFEAVKWEIEKLSAAPMCQACSWRPLIKSVTLPPLFHQCASC